MRKVALTITIAGALALVACKDRREREMGPAWAEAAPTSSSSVSAVQLPLETSARIPESPRARATSQIRLNSAVPSPRFSPGNPSLPLAAGRRDPGSGETATRIGPRDLRWPIDGSLEDQ